jgi:hypothetical protein
MRSASDRARWLEGGLMERLQWWLLLLSAVMFSMSGCASRADWQIWAGHPAHFASSNHLAFSVKSHPTLASIREADIKAAEREEWWGRLMPQEKAKAVAAAPASAPTSPADSTAASDSTVASDPTAASAPTSAAVVAPKEAWWRRILPTKKAKATVLAASVRTPAPAPAAAAADAADITGQWRGRWMASGVWGDRRESDAEMVFVQYGTKGTGRMKLADTVAALGVPEIVRHIGAMGIPMSYRISRSEVVARYEDGPAVLLRFTRVGERLYGRIDGSPSFLLVLDRQ